MTVVQGCDLLELPSSFPRVCIVAHPSSGIEVKKTQKAKHPIDGTPRLRYTLSRLAVLRKALLHPSKGEWAAHIRWGIV
jgi:hypothetical protein